MSRVGSSSRPPRLGAAQRLSFALAIAAIPAGAALAQSAQPTGSGQPAQQSQPTDKGASTVQGVTVTGQQNDFRSSPDKRSYDLTKDLQATTGSIADALRNVPSVDVDLNGNVSIRGDGNVQILVDGQPSSQFKGPGVGQALTSIPADQYERVEVMTNPSAAYSREGSGGIINLITKKTRKSGTSGSIRASQGTRGRWSVGANASYKSERMTAAINIGYRDDPQRSVDNDRRETFDALGALLSTSNQTDTRSGAIHTWYVRPSLDITLDPADQLRLEAHHTDTVYSVASVTDLVGFDEAGTQDLDLDRVGDVSYDTKTTGASTTFTHRFAGDDHTLSLTLSEDRTAEDNAEFYRDISLEPAAPDAFDSLPQSLIETLTDLKADYARPMPWGAKLKAGYELTIDDSTDRHAGFLEAAAPSGPNQVGQDDRFHARRSIDAFYATWEQPLGKLDILGGVRAESARVDIDDAASAIVRRTDRFRLYPSLNATYQISDAQQLQLSYSQRVERPVLDALDPFVFVENPDRSTPTPATQTFATSRPRCSRAAAINTRPAAPTISPQFITRTIRVSRRRFRSWRRTACWSPTSPKMWRTAPTSAWNWSPTAT